jgi:hypothetical protein
VTTFKKPLGEQTSFSKAPRVHKSRSHRRPMKANQQTTNTRPNPKPEVVVTPPLSPTSSVSSHNQSSKEENTPRIYTEEIVVNIFVYGTIECCHGSM